jgi:acyl dehydratase
MADQETDALWEELQAWVGKSLSGSGQQTGPEPVNLPMIHHWVDAFDDRNPVYEHEEFAKTTRFGGVVAPQAMLQAWTMARPILAGIAERGGAAVELPQSGPLTMLDQAGFNATLATNSELEFIRPLRPGDLLSSDVILESVSPQKKTGLGRGYFVTWISNYRDQAGELVGRQTFRVLKFNPLTMGEAR